MVNSVLIENAFIVTGNEQGTIFSNGFLYIEGNKIVELGQGQSSRSADKVINADGDVVIPGLITAHTHLYGILLRGASLNIEPPTDFAQILQRVWWPVDEALTLEDAKASALSASADMLRNGSTFFADTYSGPNSIEGSLETIMKATESVGIRSMLAFEITERHSIEEGSRGLDEAVSYARRCQVSECFTNIMMSIHASFTVSDELIERAVREASTLGMHLTIHASEGLVDLYHNLEKYGERTVERLDRLGAVGPRTVLAHCVHLNRRELEIIAERGASVAHNPMSNMLNAVGTAPVPEMLELGINVGIGNDGWIYDPFENMRVAYIQHRLATRNPSIIEPDDIFRMATINGAKCYGLQDKIGSLERGKLADIVLLDSTNVPTPITKSSIIGHLVNTFKGRDVKHTIVNGRVVVENRKLTLMPDEVISGISRESAKNLWSRLE